MSQTITKSSSLDNFILEEIDKFKDLLNHSLDENRPFDYLVAVSKSYNVPSSTVFDIALDSFNYYMRRGVTSSLAKKWSLGYAHEFILINYY